MLERFLSLSDSLRPGFSGSLGNSSRSVADSILIDGNPLPRFLLDIYSLVEGTRAAIPEQTLMDFIPGYRLIHLRELGANYEICRKIEGTGEYIPFLANYSSDFFCWRDGQILEIGHDSPTPCLIHNTEVDFFSTICDFYVSHVYFLDEYGYLNSDFDREGIVGTMHNPGVMFWQER